MTRVLTYGALVVCVLGVLGAAGRQQQVFRGITGPTLTVTFGGVVPPEIRPIWQHDRAATNSAERIIAKFGGQTRLARLLGKPQSSIEYWANCGHIPKHWHEKILNLARQCAVPVTQEELLKPLGDRGPTGRNRIPENSSVGRTIAVLREQGAPLPVDTIIQQIHERFNQRVRKETLVGNLSTYVKAGSVFYRPARGKYGLIEWTKDSKTS